MIRPDELEFRHDGPSFCFVSRRNLGYRITFRPYHLSNTLELPREQVNTFYGIQQCEFDSQSMLNFRHLSPYD